MAKIQINEDHTSHINPILEPENNRGGLFLGNQTAAMNLELIQKHRITCIITVAEELENKYPSGIKHMKISIADQPLANIYDHFEPTYHFVKKSLAEGNVLIHCRMGISRSACLVIAYLMRRYKCGLQKAFTRVKDRRRVVNPNSGFMAQLRNYEKKIKEAKKPKQ